MKRILKEIAKLKEGSRGSENQLINLKAQLEDVQGRIVRDGRATEITIFTTPAKAGIVVGQVANLPHIDVQRRQVGNLPHAF